MPTSPLAVVQGTLELLVLKALHAGGEQHGFAVLDFIRRATGDQLVLEEGALYPALHRMERRGWLISDWGVSEKGRRAKYYRLTRAGGKALADEERRWVAYVDAVARITPQPE
ncbi:MAG: PadR family transcriptional regulator [Gemmatimonadetes bacterium]|nr:PadR family transcriptional regulator [Gemmatimonadota bacterium]